MDIMSIVMEEDLIFTSLMMRRKKMTINQLHRALMESEKGEEEEVVVEEGEGEEGKFQLRRLDMGMDRPLGWINKDSEWE